jgi:hypothetical protein
MQVYVVGLMRHVERGVDRGCNDVYVVVSWRECRHSGRRVPTLNVYFLKAFFPHVGVQLLKNNYE